MRRSLPKPPRRTLATGRLLLLLLLMLLAGCFGDGKPEPTPGPQVSGPAATAVLPSSTVEPEAHSVTASPEPAAPDAPPSPTPRRQAEARPTSTPKPAGPQPLITLAVNGSRESELFQGWPLLVEVSLLHPDAMRSDVTVLPLHLGADGSPWVDALRAEVVDSTGKAVILPLRMSSGPTGTVTLDDDSISSVYLSLGSDETAGLDEGVYSLTAVLDTTDGAGGWKGVVSSIPAMMRIGKAPARLTAEQESSKTQLMAAHAVALGNVEQAMSELDALLHKEPGNIAALEFKGDLLAAEGKLAEALEVYNNALRLFYEQNLDAEQPPFGLVDKQNDVLDLLLSQD